MHSQTAFEQGLSSRGYRAIAGVDEAGRGPLAGPVVAAAVIAGPDTRIEGVADSKKLSPARRTELAARIRECALAVGVGMASHREIDEINILQASILAMHRAVENLPLPPDFLLVDGNRFHHPALPFETVVKGDATCFAIAAASIIAKVERDACMEQLDALWPEYGFARHKGYPTAEHIDAIRRLGFTPVHRRTFIVKQLVQTEAFPHE